MSPAGRFVIAADHPALPGHFPGRPVVPGVVLLDRLVQLVAGSRCAVGLPTVKFTRPVRPGEEVEVSAGAAGSRVSFRGTVAGTEVLRGTLLLADGQ